ncbi:N-acetylmuramoyl-L-alanine amidase [Fusobacterium vincentii ATCC 49256]|uniref:N-acetylmuramoyl-L-alanine amidase n=1 Tax=Fusobacterium vincentii ATCC 49256 TaxID=209882 RepID=Q7P5D0_FUSVC|nr:N-acetylmuramoyl-L-alanine amidase [Fusobacterium vincentii ATCC 49256]
MTLQIAPKVSYTMDATNKKIELNLQRTSKNKHLIVIDPGHGGKDPGAARGSVVEKKIVLAVGTYLRDELSKDFNVIMTRDSDFFVVLSERPKIGNKIKQHYL